MRLQGSTFIEEIKVYEASGLLIAAIGVVIASLPRLFTQWRTDRPAAYRTAAILLLFVGYMGLGGYLLITSFPGFSARPIKLLGFAGTAIGWIVYGALMVLEQIENDAGLPRWITQFGWTDLGALILLGAGLFALHGF
ncbi:hypothetical protein [Methyloligella halotolerans]|uniref:hypothetical protein n=1 Tax=Methyloligella halotolerans TaxID=1177755 RepID=UPI00083CB98F|nr:hypothetical protein [Methyloligella halotolerans]